MSSIQNAVSADKSLKDPASHHEELIISGPYSVLQSAMWTGSKLRARYSESLGLESDERSLNPNLHYWTSDSHRVYETAKFFGWGFLGDRRQAHFYTTLHSIPESSDLGANTLTPGKTCPAFLADSVYGKAYGFQQLERFRNTYLPAIAIRLQNSSIGLTFANEEIYTMQEMCAFEIMARGSSPWCSVFNQEDWKNFEYARDIKHYYTAGPGNKYGATMGWLWLNATASLMTQGTDAGRFFFSL